MTLRSTFANTLACLIAGSATAGALTQSVSSAPAAPAETPAYTLTGNVAAVSDYRFRGISQSFRLPAVQGCFDFTHASGFYLGCWNSSVSGNSYNNGASLEMDLYGGLPLRADEGCDGRCRRAVLRLSWRAPQPGAGRAR